MAFYRVRRALNDLWPDAGRSPSSDLSLMHRVYTKSFAKSLEERSGLRLPRPDHGPIGKVGIAMVLIGFFGAMALLVLKLVLAFVLLVAGLVVGFALTRIDAGRLPASCRTLGDLTARAASLNYGHLVKHGADTRGGSIWKALVDNLSDFAGVPADHIARDTYFLQSSLKKAPVTA